MMITGLEYYRRLQGLRQKDLAVMSGLSLTDVQALLYGKRLDSMHMRTIMRMAEATDLEIDKMIALRDESSLDGAKYIPPSGTENPMNCIAVYRRAKGLTFEMLGERLGGKTREWARRSCKAETPNSSQVRKLAALEGIDVDAFRTLYSKIADEDVAEIWDAEKTTAEMSG